MTAETCHVMTTWNYGISSAPSCIATGWFGIVVTTVGFHYCTYFKSGLVSTGMSDVHGFDLRPHIIIF